MNSKYVVSIAFNFKKLSLECYQGNLSEILNQLSDKEAWLYEGIPQLHFSETEDLLIIEYHDGTKKEIEKDNLRQISNELQEYFYSGDGALLIKIIKVKI